MNSLIKHQTKHPKNWLKYQKFDMNSSEVLISSDGSFSENKDGYSQVEYIIVVANKYDNANII